MHTFWHHKMTWKNTGSETKRGILRVLEWHLLHSIFCSNGLLQITPAQNLCSGLCFISQTLIYPLSIKHQQMGASYIDQNMTKQQNSPCPWNPYSSKALIVYISLTPPLSQHIALWWSRFKMYKFCLGVYTFQYCTLTSSFPKRCKIQIRWDQAL